MTKRKPKTKPAKRPPRKPPVKTPLPLPPPDAPRQAPEVRAPGPIAATPASPPAPPPAAPPVQPPAKPPPAPAGDAQLSRYQGFTIVRVHRSKLTSAPYNPRRWPPDAVKRLTAFIKKYKLVAPITWNVRTGHVVGGHFRLARLDALEGHGNYLLDVAQVDMDQKEEATINVGLNNPSMAGDWSLPLLEKVYKDFGIKFEDTGFDTGQVYRMFGASPLMEQPEAMADLADKVRKASERYQKVQDISASRDGHDYYLCVVFGSHDERKAFTDALKQSDNRFLDGKFLQQALAARPAPEDEEVEYDEPAPSSDVVEAGDSQKRINDVRHGGRRNR